MDHRPFINLSAASPFSIRYLIAGVEPAEASIGSIPENCFDVFEVGGTHHQIGYQTGKRCSTNIREIIRRRSEWHAGLVTTLRSKKGRSVSDKLLDLTGRHFPQILQEIRGIAEGAGIAFDSMWAMSIKSELSVLETETPGCSSIFLGNNNYRCLFHNEDGHAAYRDLMFVVRVKTPSGVSFMSMVYPGIITGNGPSLNDRGVFQTTNYIGSVQSEIGIPRYVIGRAILEAKDTKEAIDIATMAPRAYPYHHNIGSLIDQTYFSIETVPGASRVKKPGGMYVHTNHLLFEDTRDSWQENDTYISTSSLSRFEVIQNELNRLDPGKALPTDMFTILSSHQRAPYSPCRHPTEEVRGVTLGTAFIDLKNRSFLLYKGNPCNSVNEKMFLEFTF